MCGVENGVKNFMQKEKTVKNHGFGAEKRILPFSRDAPPNDYQSSVLP